MFKFIKRLLIYFVVTIVLVAGSLLYFNYKTQSNIIDNLSTVSNQNENNTTSSKKNDNKPTTNSNIEKNINNPVEISKEISDILSDENKYDLAIKCDGINALVSIDSSTKETSLTKINTDDEFYAVTDKADKYINFDSNSDYNIEDLKTLKERFDACNLSEKYAMIKDILNNTDTNIKESDLINIYFQYIAQK